MSWEGKDEVQTQAQTLGAHPIAHPIATSKKPHLTSINIDLGSLNDGAHAGTTLPNLRRKQRMKPHDIEEIARRLSDRDWAILRSVAEHQFLTIRQVEALHFAENAAISGSRIARRTLARLRDLRLLGTLTRRVGGVGAGSDSRVHYLNGVGDQLLNRRSGRKSRRRSRDPSFRFLSHRLAIADTHVTLVEADRHGHIELVVCAIEPASWRRFPGLGGARLTLKPDMYVETAVPSDSDLVHAWFVEVDLGNEGIQTLLKKCHDYEAYRRTGIEQDREGGFPHVVWSMTHPDPEKATRRREALQDTIDSDRSLTSKLFRIIAPDQLVSLLTNGGAV